MEREQYYAEQMKYWGSKTGYSSGSFLDVSLFQDLFETKSFAKHSMICFVGGVYGDLPK
jgi:hypothetical protein